jgi:hypothetical protein
VVEPRSKEHDQRNYHKRYFIMDEKENIFDIRSNIDPVDNKPYVEVLKEDKDYKARFAAKNKKDFNVQLKKDNVEADVSKGPGGKRATVGYNKGNFKIQASKGPEGNSAMFSYTKTLGSEAKEDLSKFVDSKADGGFIIGKGKDYIKDLL